MADDTDDPIEQGPSYPGRGGFEFKKAIVLQQFNLKAAKFAESLIGKPWDRDACELGLQDLASLVFELSKPTFKKLPPDVHIERDLSSTEIWEVVADGPRRPPRDSVRYQQNPELFHAEQLEIWRMLQDRVQCQLESLQESQYESVDFSVVEKYAGISSRRDENEQPSEESLSSVAAAANPNTSDLRGRSEHLAYETVEDSVFRKEGERWRLVFSGREVHVNDRKGLGYIANLLRSPGKEFYCTELLAAGHGGPLPTLGSAGESLDPAAFENYRLRVEDLEDQLAEADRNHDQGRKELLQAELDQVTDEIQRATGLGGRHRKTHDDAEKIRKGVSNAITRAIEAIRAHHRELADHLKMHIKLGSFVTCKPDGSPWQF